MRVKKLTLLLLTYISDGVPFHHTNPKYDSITKRLGKSKQALNYHIRKLEKLNFIEKKQSYPFAIYEVTSLGERVKENLVHSEGLKNLWKCHSLIVGFDVQSFGTFRFINTTKRKIIPMNNWNYAMEEKGKFKVHIQDSGLMKIYCPEKYTKKPDEAFGKMYAEAQSIAQRYCDRYRMELKQLKIIRKGHKTLIGSRKLAKLMGRVNLGEMWVDASDGTDELEERQDEYSIESLLELPDRMDVVERAIDKQTEAINRQSEVDERLSRNIELHLEVLKGIKEAIKNLSEKIKEKQTSTQQYPR